jgi:5'-3' exonuclease
LQNERKGKYYINKAKIIKKMGKAKYIIKRLGIIIGIIAIISVVFCSCFGGLFDKVYSVDELKKEYYSHEKEIREAKRYFASIITKDKEVQIEFTSDEEIGRCCIYDTLFAGDPNYEGFCRWDFSTNSKVMDTVFQLLKWDKDKLKILKKKLDDANCIGITNSEPAELNFKRSGMGLYSFLVFDKSIPDSLKNNYNDSCYYILAGDKVVLTYGGGVFGPQCFPRVKKKK